MRFVAEKRCGCRLKANMFFSMGDKLSHPTETFFCFTFGIFLGCALSVQKNFWTQNHLIFVSCCKKTKMAGSRSDVGRLFGWSPFFKQKGMFVCCFQVSFCCHSLERCKEAIEAKKVSVLWLLIFLLLGSCRLKLFQMFVPGACEVHPAKHAWLIGHWRLSSQIRPHLACLGRCGRWL